MITQTMIDIHNEFTRKGNCQEVSQLIEQYGLDEFKQDYIKFVGDYYAEAQHAIDAIVNIKVVYARMEKDENPVRYGVEVTVYAYDNDGEVEEHEFDVFNRGRCTLSEANAIARRLNDHLNEFTTESDSEND